MPDNVSSWLIVALLAALPALFAVGVWYAAKVLADRRNVRTPRRGRR